MWPIRTHPPPRYFGHKISGFNGMRYGYRAKFLISLKLSANSSQQMTYGRFLRKSGVFRLESTRGRMSFGCAGGERRPTTIVRRRRIILCKSTDCRRGACLKGRGESAERSKRRNPPKNASGRISICWSDQRACVGEEVTSEWAAIRSFRIPSRAVALLRSGRIRGYLSLFPGRR